MSKVTFVKTSVDANQRVRKGVHEFKVACYQCGLEKWVTRKDIWSRHQGCFHGIFMLVQKEEKK